MQLTPVTRGFSIHTAHSDSNRVRQSREGLLGVLSNRALLESKCSLKCPQTISHRDKSLGSLCHKTTPKFQCLRQQNMLKAFQKHGMKIKMFVYLLGAQRRNNIKPSKAQRNHWKGLNLDLGFEEEGFNLTPAMLDSREDTGSGEKQVCKFKAIVKAQQRAGTCQ